MAIRAGIRLALLLAGLSLAVHGPLASAQESAGVSPTSEYALKAAFLYNFALFTEWPKLPGEAFDFCILGPDPFGPALDALARKSLHGRSIRPRRLPDGNDAYSCHLLFIASSAQANWTRLAADLRQQPILTVAEASDGDGSSAMIRIVPDGNRLAFEINQSAAKTAGLVLSSKLLRLARHLR